MLVVFSPHRCFPQPHGRLGGPTPEMLCVPQADSRGERASGARAGTANPGLTASHCMDRIELRRGALSSGHMGSHQAQQWVEEELDSPSIVPRFSSQPAFPGASHLPRL